MQPSNHQLLKQLRKSTQQLAQEAARPEHKALLEAMDVVLNELLLRCDRDFFVDYYDRGRRLLMEGLELLGDQAGSLRADTVSLAVSLDPRFGTDTIGAQSVRLSDLLTQLIRMIGTRGEVRSEALLRRITAWELSLLAHRLKRIPVDHAQLNSLSVTIARESLETYLRRKKPEWKDLEVTHFQRIAGGFSKCTLLFDTLDTVNGSQSFAIRAEQPIHIMDLDGSDVSNEFWVVRKAFESGIPVAEPLWLETDRQFLNTRFIVSRKAVGRNFGTAKGGESRLSLAATKDLARVIARIHDIPLERDAHWVKASHFGKWMDVGATTRQNTLARVDYWNRQCLAANIFPSPCITRALTWLAANVPDYDEPPVFLHGDFGPHNVLLDGDRVSAALDWEISTPGDPAYDVAWFLNCAGVAVDREEFLAAYRDADGKTLSEYRLRYYDVFVSMMMPATCNASLRLVEEQDAANINIALYGLQFMHEYPSRLEAAIANAEAVTHLQ
ncbi:MAG: phosphotransferase family protein [Steroidobacteraceae bacterium]